MKERVMVWSKPYELDVHQRSKSVWVASGEYMGKHIQEEDRSRTTTAVRWREAAHYRGNDGSPPDHCLGRYRQRCFSQP